MLGKQPNPAMPATPQLFSVSCHPLVTVRDSQPVGRWGQILIALTDRFAAEGYEDEDGFHFCADSKPVKAARIAEPVCLGEHI